jgi:hypothetical protein
VAPSTLRAQAAEYDPVEGGVGLPVAAAVEAVPGGLAGAGGDRGDAAEHGECGLGGEPIMVLAGADQQLAGDLGADAVGGQQAGVDGGDERLEQLVEVGDLDGQLPVAAGQTAQGELDGGDRGRGVDPVGFLVRAGGNQLLDAQAP